MATSVPGGYDTAGEIPWGSILGNAIDKAIGESTDSTTNANQQTNATGSQNTTGSTIQTGYQHGGSNTNSSTLNAQQQNSAFNQNQSGTTSQNTTGSQQTTGSNRTSGTVDTFGTKQGTTQTQQEQTSRTSGSTQTTTDSSKQFQNSSQTSADISRLMDVYARQSAGITPEMLAAIFREGSKQAPNALLAQSAALGARAGNNTPVAVALNMLNRDMVDQAARYNMQLLKDAGLTAGQIGELTKRVDQSGSESGRTVSNTIQDIVNTVTGNTTTNTNEITNNRQIQDLLTAIDQTTTSNQNVAGTSNVNTSGTSNVGTVGTTQNNTTQGFANNSLNTTNSNQQTNTTQNQNVTSTENKEANRTINAASTKNLLTAAAGGVGIAALLSMAKQSGFLGSAKELVQQLVQWGGNLLSGDVISALNEQALSFDENSVGLGGDAGGVVLGGGLGSGWDPNQVGPDPFGTGTGTTLTGNEDADGWGDGQGGDGEGDWGFADGGVVEMPNLLGFNPIIRGGDQPRGGTDSLMAAALGSANAARSMDPLNGIIQQLMGGAPSSGGAAAPGGQGGNGGLGNSGSGGVGTGVSSGGFSSGADSSSSDSGALGYDTGKTIDRSMGPVASFGLNVAAKALGVPGWVMGLIAKPVINSLLDSKVMMTYENPFSPMNLSNIEAISPLDQALSVQNLSPLDFSQELSALDAAINGQMGWDGQGLDGFSGYDAGTDGLSGWSSGDGWGNGGIGSGGSGGGFGGDGGGFGAGAGYGAGGGYGSGVGGYGSGIGGGFGGFGGGFGGDGGGDGGGGDGGGGDGGGDGGDADGGMVTPTRTIRSYDDVLCAFGITRGTDGGFSASPQAAKRMAYLLKNSGKPQAKKPGSSAREHDGDAPDDSDDYADGGRIRDARYGNGGEIRGPGHGTSDSIPAVGPAGRKMRVANGEYIISADVVDQLGVDFFDALQDKYHVPADMQRALGIKS